jgi:2-polyprenyl-3-methyl-5-hydroxy-6-metoxy-1,4-benzoquinol methylase
MDPSQTPVICPLCRSDNITRFHRDAHRPYLRCGRCRLVFVPPENRLTRERERAEYERHQNSPADTGYRRFLSRLFRPLCAELQPGVRGLDFGCGPGPTLSVMFEEAGFPVTLYDPFFYPDRSVLTANTYDFITATEVLEHLHRPAEDLDRLWACLKPGGVLGVMTKRVIDQAAFARWHYIRDVTHVCFYAEETFAWFCERWGAGVRLIEPDVALILKRPL